MESFPQENTNQPEALANYASTSSEEATQQYEPTNIGSADSETGLVSPGKEYARRRDIIDLRLAYHGLVYLLHKNTHESNRPVTSRPKIAARAFARSNDKRKLKRDIADTYQYRYKKIFGDEDQQTGLNKKDRKERRQDINLAFRRGDITATEASVQKTLVDAAPLKLGEETHGMAQRRLRKADAKFSAHHRERNRQIRENKRRSREFRATQKGEISELNDPEVYAKHIKRIMNS